MAGEPSRGVVLSTPDLELRFDERGRVTRAVHPPSGAVWLSGAAEVVVGAAGRAVALGRPRVSVDADEVEVERVGEGLRVVVRHAVDRTWDVRVVLANDSAAALVLDDVRLRWRAAPGTVVTALAGGAVALHVVQPASGEGPLLVGRLRAGAQHGVDERALLLGPLVLQAGHRFAVQWRWDVVDQPRRADPRGDLPRTCWLELEQTVVLPAGPDVAVVAPDLDVSVGEDSVEVGSPVPAAAVVELRSARGTRAYPLAWAPGLDELVDAEVEALLVGPVAPSGTVRLQDAAAGLVVQDALHRRSAGAPEEAAEALELASGLVAEQVDAQVDDAGAGPPDPLALALLAREADRATGATARGLLRTASAGLRAHAVPVPGLGLAGLAVALAGVRAGEAAATEAVDHLAALRTASSPLDGPGLELAVLLRADGASASSSSSGPVVAGLRRLGAALGAGLPGRVVPPPPLELLARAAALLALVDEPTGQRLRSGWGITASELARRCAAQVRARIADDPEDDEAGRALAWLVLGRPVV